MSFRRPQNPGEVRAVMEATYARYAMGLDMFPKARLQSDPSDLPKKSQAIGRTLANAWARIDEDDAYFLDAMLKLVGKANEKIQSGDVDDGRMLAITQVGRHCVKMASVLPTTDQPEVTLGIFPRAEFVEEFEGVEFNVSGGRRLTFIDGQMQMDGGAPDLFVVRGSNVSGVYLSDNDQVVS